MAYIVTSIGTKGGSGKTSLVKGLSITKASEGKKVLIIDLCQNSDIATRLGYNREDFEYDTYDWVSGKSTFEQTVQHDEETGIDFIPASNLVEKIVEFAQKKRIINREWVLKEKIDLISDQYDYIFIDNHPTETNNMIIMSLIASDLAMVPMIMDISCVVATIRTVDIVKGLREQGVDVDLQIVPMAVDFSKGFKKELKEIEDEFEKMDIFGITHAIRYSAVILRAGLNGEVIKKDNEYYEKVMSDYKIVADNIGG